MGQALVPRKLESRLLRDLTRESDVNRDIRLVRSFVQNAFQGGKMKAVRQLGYRHDYGIGDYDLTVIQDMRRRYIRDLEKIRADAKAGEEQAKNQRRLAVLAAALVWQAYNQGKLSSFRQRAEGKIGQVTKSAQVEEPIGRGAEERIFWITELDDRVCDVCMNYEMYSANIGGWSVYDLRIPSIPFDSHPNCRCEYESGETVQD
jgi:hypothetical protein